MLALKTRSGAATPASTTSLIGSGLTIHGEINTDADIRIDGRLIGNINSTAKVVIGTDGCVEGNIAAQHADITGKVMGNLSVKELLNLRENANIKGDINAAKIAMEPSVTFNGKCCMNAATQVVEMNADKHERRTAVAE